jgi:hypothetical protein
MMTGLLWAEWLPTNPGWKGDIPIRTSFFLWPLLFGCLAIAYGAVFIRQKHLGKSKYCIECIRCEQSSFPVCADIRGWPQNALSSRASERGPVLKMKTKQ